MIQYVQEAPAKINLTLRILGRRADGFHNLASVVAFADKGDELALTKGDSLSLTVSGPFAAAAGPDDSNLVLRAARLLKERIPELKTGHFKLTKNLPAGAGVGGGSTDAAAALRLLAIANGLALNNPHIVDAAAAAGADVPVCLMASARLMHGRGEIVSAPLELPTLPVVLVFPGIPLATAPVFAAFDPAAITRHTPYQEREIPRTLDAVLEFLRNEPNDLEPAAKKLVPSIGIAMGKLRQTDAVLVRMSGSGSAVFGIYRTKEAAQAAAQTIKTQQPDWWVEDAKLK